MKIAARRKGKRIENRMLSSGSATARRLAIHR
jgi:hypothetical protein